MTGLIPMALSRPRTILMLFVLLLITGTATYLTIPRESSPDIPIPFVYVSVHHEGISPEDSERLLVFPLEKELQGLSGIKELKATALHSHASLTIEFTAGTDLDKALSDVRDKVNLARSKLPDGTDEPVIKEITMASASPVVTAILSGPLPERALVKTARAIKDVLEKQRQILEVDIAGDREEVVDIIVDPLKLESYGLVPADVVSLVFNNNQLVAAGNMDTGSGRFSIKVPAVYKTPADILHQPVKVEQGRVVTFADVATVLSTYKEGGDYARLNGESSVALEIKKRPGENIIETVALTRHIISEAMKQAPDTLTVHYVGDESEGVRDMVTDLQNNVLSAIILVVIIIIGALGSRSALLVGIAIPGSFLSGILILGIMGLTINMIVLFSLIMAVGMLVDGAIVVTELADRRMSEGVHRRQAYLEASRRMAWPIIASTATTLAAFFPLMFWPGTMGEFMKYLPLTLIATLTSSLVMALIFIPTIGSLIGKTRTLSTKEQKNLKAAEQGDWPSLSGISAVYIKLLGKTVHNPVKTLMTAFAAVGLIFWSFSNSSLGVEYFPDVDTDAITVTARVHSGNLSVNEKDRILQQLENALADTDEIESLYAKTGADQIVGTLTINLVHWQHRTSTLSIAQMFEDRLSAFHGLAISIERRKSGPPKEKAIELVIRANDLESLATSVEQIKNLMRRSDAFINIEDSGPAPGYEWRLDVDRENAARLGASVSTTGSMVRVVTSGLVIGSYRPDDADDEVDLRIRFPESDRHMDTISQLRLMTSAGLTPISNFSTMTITPKLDKITRLNGQRSITVTADLLDGEQLAKHLPDLLDNIRQSGLPDGVSFEVKGQQQEQMESGIFLIKAFTIALFIMAIILVTQFNSFYQAGLIMSAVILATGGVFLALMITGQNFGIVMSGVGIISLAGIVVNNNIVLIDTYNSLRKTGLDAVDACLRTGAQRLRPVLLTTITTILGLMPMVLSININLFNHSIETGAPFTQIWNQLATAIAGGLAFATFLTLVVTPAFLVLSGLRQDRRAAQLASE